jgi:hypothetical protein
VDSSGNAYVADYNNDRIQKFDSSGNFLIKWGKWGAGEGDLNRPYGVAVDTNGYVYVSEASNNRIQKFDIHGNFITQWGNVYGSKPGHFYYPTGISVDPLGYVYVADTYNSRIQKFDSSGNFIALWGNYGQHSSGPFNCHLGKPPALPGDSQSLTFAGVRLSFRASETRPGIQETPDFCFRRNDGNENTYHRLSNDCLVLILSDCDQAPLRGQQS